jgi:hypothetical protein
MKVEFLERFGSWRSVADAARTTINMEAGTKEPSSNWKRRMVMCEHSPIRKLRFNWKWIDLKYWVSVHFVRHKFGIEHWISTQRDDRTTTINQDHTSRGKAPQDTPVTHEVDVNTQAVINISRKRKCMCASPETREAWNTAIDELAKTEPEVASCCVRECVYRNGLCPEFRSCGYNKTEAFEKELKEYIKGFENQINEKTLIK